MTVPSRHPRTRTIATLGSLAAMAAAVVVAVRLADLPASLTPEGCEATVDGVTVSLDLEQAHAASLIAATAVARGLPARAATIALATAYQESDLRNVTYGDRDSLGLFQQRPSQGWGTEAQVQDPVHATNAFYDALVKIDGYRDMEVTVAAQEVQRSGFPAAYSDHEADARVLASAFTGYSPAALSCSIRPDSVTSQTAASDAGLSPRAQAAVDAIRAAYGERLVGAGESINGAPGSSGFDLPVESATDESKAVGWSLAHWLVANADRLSLATVTHDSYVWSAERSDDGWQLSDAPSGATGDPAVTVGDAVHVEVLANSQQ